MNVGGSETDDPKVIAQGFNDYFSSVASLLDANIPSPVSDASMNVEVNLVSSMFLTPVTPSEIVDMVNTCLLYTSPSPRDKRQSRMPSSA